MKRLSITVLLGGFLLSTCSPVMAQAVCGERASLLKQLSGQYKETPISMGLANGGAIVEVTRSETGSWSLLITTPNGVTCLMGAGENWEILKSKTKGKPS